MAVYAGCAKAHRLTVNELFVLDILWFSPEGQTQKEICDRLSANKQTIAAIAGRFLKKGFVSAEEVAEDRRNKRLRLTKAGTDYARGIIPSARRGGKPRHGAVGDGKNGRAGAPDGRIYRKYGTGIFRAGGAPQGPYGPVTEIRRCIRFCLL